VKTGDADEDDERVGDWGSEFRCGNKKDAGKFSAETRTDWCRYSTEFCFNAFSSEKL